MAERMTSRERVLTALHHQEPDRVPTALWGSYYTLQDQTYFNLLEYSGLGEPVPPFRRYKTKSSNYHDDRVLDQLNTDVRYVWLGFTDLGGARPDTLTDAWGVQHRQVGQSVYAVGHPLAEASIDQVEDYAWPDPERYITLDILKNRVATLRKAGSHAIAARAVSSYGPFEQASALRGREQLMMDLLLEPQLARLVIDKVTDIIVRLTEILLDVAGQYLDIIEIPGDDYGSTDNLMFSPAVFDSAIRPALERIIRPIKQYRRDLFVAFHSDGAIVPLLGAFAELGIDLFHPLEPLPANDMRAAKAQYGDRLSFMGAIDVRQAMPGSVADVENEVKRRIELLAPGGGYILAPANHLQTDVPAENIVRLYEFGRHYGRYPLK